METMELELTGQSLGIIGMGTLGQMLAQKAQSFGMMVYYHSRTRKPQVEEKGVHYLPLGELLQKADIVSTHLPRHTRILAGKLPLFGPGKVLINTSLGPTFDPQEFQAWISQTGNFAIFDGDALGNHRQELTCHERVIYTDKVTGWTQQAKHRLSQKAVANLKSFLGK